jgi:zinc transporter, ZIP family
MEFENLKLAFLLTIFAGLATGIGSILALVTKTTNKKFLSIALGFSAGVMLYVSFLEIIPKGTESLTKVLGSNYGALWAFIAFFAGLLFTALIDRIVPAAENPHEIKLVEQMSEVEKDKQNKKKLMRMGLFSALAITIHNFPEGLATFMATLEDPTLGVAIAVAVALHNIPEGIAVSVPIYYATGSRIKAFIYSFLSGLAEPVGALIGFFFLYQFMNELTFGLVFSAVAGIMVYISMDELLPAAQEYEEHHYSIFGLTLGMMVMGSSLIMLNWG